MRDPRTDHGQKLGNGSARARSPSPARAAALARRDNEVACPYLRALIKRQTRELSCRGVLVCPLRPYFFFFFASAARSAAGVGTKQKRSTKAQGASVSSAPRSLRPAANAIDATSRLLDISPVADNAGRGSSTSSSRGAGRSRTGRGGPSRRIYAAPRSRRPRRRCRRRPRRPSCSRAGRSTAGGASSSSSATCRSGAASSRVPASLDPSRAPELSTQVCPGVDHGRIAFFVAFWERRGSGVDLAPLSARW